MVKKSCPKKNLLSVENHNTLSMEIDTFMMTLRPCRIALVLLLQMESTLHMESF